MTEVSLTMKVKMLPVLKHFALFNRIFLDGSKNNLIYVVQRNLFLTCQICGNMRNPKDKDEDDELGKPIKFSSSKASHRSWTVDRSLGSTYQRPLWKVVPVSLIGVCFLLWCVFRKESDVDEQLEKQLYEQLPGLLSEEEDDEQKTKPSS